MRTCRIQSWISLRTSFTRFEIRRTLSVFPTLQQNATEIVQPKRFEEIPGPMKIPYLKSAWAFLPYIGQYDSSSLETSYMKMYVKYGKMVRLETPNDPPAIFLFDRELIRKVFSEEGSTPYRPGLKYLLKYRQSRLDKYPNIGLFLLQGEDWKNLRSVGQKPMLRIPSVRLYLNSMESVSKDFIERLRELRDENMEVQDILPKLFRWALESVGVFALHKRLGCLDKDLSADSDSQRLINAINDTFVSLYELEMAGGWKGLFPKKSYEKLVRSQDYFNAMISKYLKEALDEIKTQKIRKDGGENYLLNTFQENKMDVVQAIGIIMDLFFAGIDTTSSTVAFTLHYIASFKEKQQQLHEEISRILPTKDSPVTGEALDSVPFLRACVKEALRLHPITVGSARVLDHDIILDGYHVPKGTMLGLFWSLTSRLPEYFEQPDKFLPERWLEGSTKEERLRRRNVGLKETYDPAPFASIPFSHGVRMCIGRRFAEQEIYVLLIKLLQNFTLEYKHAPIKTRLSIVNVPDRPLHVVFKDKE